MTSKKDKSIIRNFIFRILYPLSEKYLSKERNYRYKDISIVVFPGVFHPGFYFSTKILLRFIEEIDLKEKYILELGAGTGLISIYAAKKGGFVTASDISEKAVQNIEKNTRMNDANVEVIHSDLFDKTPQRRFDYILINPPYYQKSPSTEKELAWLCGDDFQYFRRLFSQLGNHILENTTVFMILSDEANIGMIKSIAEDFRFKLDETYHEKIWGEQNYIYSIKSL